MNERKEKNLCVRRAHGYFLRNGHIQLEEHLAAGLPLEQFSLKYNLFLFKGYIELIPFKSN